MAETSHSNPYERGTPRRRGFRSALGGSAGTPIPPASQPAGVQAFSFRDRAVHLDAHGVLVLADVHLGRDETSNVEFRLGEHGDVTRRFAALVERFEPAEVVVAGDLLHSFSSLPRGVTETVQRLERTAREAGAGMTVTPGNHDSMLASVWDGPTVEEYRIDGRDGDDAGSVCVTHGHAEPDTEADCYVVGHEHPAIDIEGQRRPCYLWGEGTYRGADLLVVPAFTRLAAGVEVNRLSTREFRCPLVTNADALRPVVRDASADESLEFPPLGQFRRML